jgi:hypothetical protein
MGHRIWAFSGLILLAVFFYPVNFSLAQTSQEFTVIDGDKIKTDPVAQQILQKIEESKKILERLQKGEISVQMSEQQKFIEQQRQIAKQKLQDDLSRMNKDYEAFTPRNAYSTFLTGINSTHHGIYWDQFNYMDAKVSMAKSAKESILAGGGTFQEAMSEYIRIASMTRNEMIKTVADFNIKHGFTDTELQSHFDENGKIQRTDEEFSPCFSCDRYEEMGKQMILESLNKNNSTTQGL